MKTYQEILDIIKAHEQNGVSANALTDSVLFAEQAKSSGYGVTKCSLMYLDERDGNMFVETQRFNSAGAPITRDEYIAS